MTRLLVVSHFYPEHQSGVEIIAGELANRFVRRGFDVEWAASDLNGITSSKTPYTRTPMQTWNGTEQRLGVPYPIWGPRSIARLWKAVRRADIVHLHDCLYMGNVFAAAFARWLKRPLFVTQHIGLVPYRSHVLRGLMSLANRTIGRFVLASAQQCVFYSPAAFSYFQRSTRFRRRPVHIQNGVDTKLFRPLDETCRNNLRKRLGWSSVRPQMLFVGRFVEKKGLHHIRALAERFPECDWSLVGWGPDDPLDWGLPNVRCLGRMHQAKIVEYYQAADLLVLPSVGEGFPLVVQEAMACGTPALVSDSTAAGSPDASAHLIVAKLTKSALESKLREVLPTLSAGRSRVAAFARSQWDWESCIDRYVDVLNQLIRAGRTA